MTKKGMLGFCVLAMIGCLAGCAKKENSYVEGVYLTYGENNELYVFSDKETDSLFLAEIPNDVVYDQNGNKTTRDILDYGDTVRIYHDGTVLESMPPQYSNVTKVELEEEAVKMGKEEKERYEKQIDSFYRESDETEIPMLAIETTIENQLSAVKVNPVSFKWEFVDEDGNTQHNASSLAKDQDVPTVACEGESGSVQLYFSLDPKKIKVLQCNKKENRELEIEKNDTGYFVSEVEAGKTYQVEGIWEDHGMVTYKFTVTKIESE